MTPADELRTAAEKLRTLSTAIAPPDEKHLPFHADGSQVTQGQHGLYDVAQTETPQLAAYIAAMGPNVGEALADWLDIAVEYAERWPPDAQTNSPFRLGALAVAREVNRAQP